MNRHSPTTHIMAFSTPHHALLSRAPACDSNNTQQSTIIPTPACRARATCLSCSAASYILLRNRFRLLSVLAFVFF